MIFHVIHFTVVSLLVLWRFLSLLLCFTHKNSLWDFLGLYLLIYLFIQFIRPQHVIV